MPNYGTHTYDTDLQATFTLSSGIEYYGLQWKVSITITRTSPYVPAQLCGPPEHCDPAEAAEYEFDEFRFCAGKVMILKSTDWAVAEALFGANIWNHLYDDAVVDAEENQVEEDER